MTSIYNDLYHAKLCVVWLLVIPLTLKQFGLLHYVSLSHIATFRILCHTCVRFLTL